MLEAGRADGICERDIWAGPTTRRPYVSRLQLGCDCAPHPLLPHPTWWLQPLCSASFTAGVKVAASAKWNGLQCAGRGWRGRAVNHA